MLTDSHCHLDFPEYAGDLEAVLERAAADGVSRLVTIGTSVESSRRAVALAEKYPQVWAVVGIHPNNAHEVDDRYIADLRELAQSPRVVAIGEAGLDYYWLPGPTAAREKKSAEEIAACADDDAALRVQQAAVFRQQLELCRELQLNMVVHQRSAWEDTMQILTEYPGGPQCVLHCFGETWNRAEEVFRLGHLISFTGIVTFKNGKAAQEAATRCRADQFMVETDSPFLSPEPHRGQRCEPGRTRLVAEKIAQLRQIPLEQLAQETEAVANRFFRFQ